MTGAAAGQSGKPAADSKIVDKDGQRYYEGPVTWTIDVTAPKTAKPGETFLVAGIVGYQTCKTNSACDTPQAVRFAVDVPITDKTTTGSSPVVFTPAKYPEAAKAAQLAAAAAPPPLDPRTFAWVIGASLLGGFILNLMPCVLPVVGLKILSFVEQAHHERGQILALNIAYAAGILAVFMALAALSAGLGQAWGEQFTSKEFNIALAALVFVMALSFLGVWEIPIPGFVGSSRAGELAQREGLAGAFSKGILTTILATPCSGPALGFVFGFTLGQPAYVVFTVFACIGLGMAAPYLLIAAFPPLIRFLPKPGEWMETFKQAMGFVLLGTVVFVFTFLDKDYLVPTFGLLIGLWFCCWWIGRTPLTEPAATRFRAWGAGIAAAAVIGWLSFAYLGPPTRILPWEPFSQTALAKATAEGKTVMIDFTADWCLTCKLNLKWAVDTEETLRLVNENKIVPLLADWTKPNPEIKETLNSLGSNSIPVLAIFPAGRPTEPIVLRDLLKQGDVIEALRQAGPSATAPSTAASAGTHATAMQTP
jgi:thiol:disulfide interchange protein